MKKIIFVMMFALLPLFTWAGNSNSDVQPFNSSYPDPNPAYPMWINNYAHFYDYCQGRLYTFVAEGNCGDTYVWELSGDATIHRINRLDSKGNPVEIALKMNPFTNGVTSGAFTLKLKKIEFGIVVEEVVLEGSISNSHY